MKNYLTNNFIKLIVKLKQHNNVSIANFVYYGKARLVGLNC